VKPAITTITLLVVNVVLLGYIFLIDNNRLGTDEERAVRGKLADFDEGAVTQILLTTAEGKATIVKRPDGSWSFSTPFKDRFDPELMKELLKESNRMFIRNTIDEKEIDKEGWDDNYFGLGKGAIGLEMLAADGEELASFTIGAPTPTEGLVYAQRKGKDSGAVYAVEGYAREIVASPFNELRDLRLIFAKVDDVYRVKFFPPPPAGIAGIEVRVEKGLDRRWRMEKPLEAAADEELVKELVSKLAKLEIAEIIDEPAADMNAAFDEQSYEIVVRQRTPAADNTKITIEFGKLPVDENDPYVLARVSDRDGLFKVDRRVHYEFGMNDGNALRDRTLADFDYNAVSRVEIERHGLDMEDILLVRGRGGWALQRDPTEPDELEAANSGMVKKLIEDINGEEVLKFSDDAVSNLAQYGLEEPMITVTVTRLYIDPAAEVKDGEERLMIPITKKLLIGASKAFQPFPEVFATFEGEPYVYKIDKFLLGDLRLMNPLGFRTMQLWPKFTAFDLRRITIKDHLEQDPLTLDYDPDRGTWKAMLGAVDVTDEIDRVVLDGYLETLGRPPRGESWTEAGPRSIQRLSEPDLTVIVDLIDPQDRQTPRRIELLSSSTKIGGEFYYGRINRSPDVILLKDSVIQSLRTPLKRLRRK
jgi:hypothetical protein